jgi:hypothetical protein
MPVICDAGMGGSGLIQHFGESSKILATVSHPLPSELMERYDISTLVSAHGNDTAESIQPLLSEPAH